MLQTYGLSVAYEGDNIHYNAQTLYDMTPALISFANVIRDVANIIQPEAQPFNIDVVTGTNFGFLYKLQGPDKYTFSNLLHLIKSEPVKRAVNFDKLFTILVDVFNFVKVVNNRQIVNRKQLPEQHIQVCFADGTFFDTTVDVLKVYDDENARKDILGTLKPLKTLGADRFTFYTETNQFLDVDL